MMKIELTCSTLLKSDVDVQAILVLKWIVEARSVAAVDPPFPRRALNTKEPRWRARL